MTEYFVGEGLDGWSIFWLRLGFGLPFEVGVGTLFVEDDACLEVKVVEALASTGDAWIYWIGLTGCVVTLIVDVTG